jgi:hypothetical protein
MPVSARHPATSQRPLPLRRAECLKELNDGVAGSFVDEDPSTLIAANPSFFSGFDLVVATQLRRRDAAALDAVCRQRCVTLLLARSHGLVGYVRVRARVPRRIGPSNFRGPGNICAATACGGLACTHKTQTKRPPAPHRTAPHNLMRLSPRPARAYAALRGRAPRGGIPP